MRILFAFAGGTGHAEPLVPLANAAVTAGHAVAFAGRATALVRLEARGFEVFPTEQDPAWRGRRIDLRPVDLERERAEFREHFADRIAREKAAALLALAENWRPDAVVTEETDFGSLLAAERLGLPCASVVVLAARTFATPELVAAALDAVRAEHGLPADPGLELLARPLSLAPFPPAYRDPRSPLPERTLHYRPQSRSAAAVRSEPPLVYFSLGTAFTLEVGDLYQRAVAGLRELGAEVLVTVGDTLDPAELGPQPAHVRVERYVPQAETLPRASLVVSHGGSGSVLGALAHGLPMVLLPMGADQPFNAARCEELGVARALDAVAATSAEIRDAAADVLAEPSYRDAAERLRDEFAALPGPEYAVALVERRAR